MSQIILSQDQVAELVEYLRGSSNSLEDGFATIGVDMDTVCMSSFDAIDAQIFRCDSCSWWYDENDNTGDMLCQNCYSAMLEDDSYMDFDKDESIEDYPEDIDFDSENES